MTIRDVIYLVGLILMAIALALPLVPSAEPRGWFSWSWLFSLGLLLALGAHGFPASFS